MPSIYEIKSTSGGTGGIYGTGGSKKKKGPSVLNRVFDVLSRGNYATAEATSRLLKGKNLGSVAKGAAAGLAGKKKTSFSNVLREQGVKGPLAAVGGFVGDIALDPTTYATFGASGVARGGGKAVALKLGGKPVLKSEKLYKGGQKAVKEARGTELVKEISKTFNPGAGLTPEIRGVQQKHKGIGGTKYSQELTDLKHKYTGTSVKERELISEYVLTNRTNMLPEHLREFGKEAAKEIGRVRPRKPIDVLQNKSYPEITDILAKKKRQKLLSEAHDRYLEEVHKRFAHQLKDPEILNAVNYVAKTFSDDPKLSGWWVKQFDKVQSLWKTQATVMNPGHHVRNLVGDTYMNSMDGVVSTKPYRDAIKIVSDHVKDAKVNLGKFGTVDKKGIRELYEGQGLKSGYVQSEDLLKGPSRFKRASKVLEKVSSGTDKREDFARYAHFIDAIRKESKKAKSLDEAVEKAAARVRKFNFDYSDLTPRERKYLKRWVPFYTFTRKALPVHLELLMMQPGKIARIPKGTRAIEQLLGSRTDEHEPLPGLSEALPPWYENKHVLSAGENKIISPSLPVDVLGEFSQGGPAGVGKETIGRVSPLIRAPIELATGRTLESGFKVKPKTYIQDQLAYPRLIRQQVSDKDKKREKEHKIAGKNIDERQLNWLTGLGLHRVNPPPSKKKNKGKGIYGLK